MIKSFSLILALLSAAAGTRAQDFDYYVMALTWTPSWCLSEGDADADQCDRSRDLGFTLHGLWPQDDTGGWPEYCDLPRSADPSRRQTAAMADVMGSGGLAWYQWKKHGRCSGLASEDYFARARRAYLALDLPRPDVARPTADAVEATLLAANPALAAEDVVVTCRAGLIAEARVCLTRDLVPRACGPDVARDACRQRGPLEMPAVR